MTTRKRSVATSWNTKLTERRAKKPLPPAKNLHADVEAASRLFWSRRPSLQPNPFHSTRTPNRKHRTHE